MYHAEILADSISDAGFRLTTFEIELPRIVLAELNTHRQFSRNSASSRAIPVERRVSVILNDPFLPQTWGSNQKGMVAGDEIECVEAAKTVWLSQLAAAAAGTRRLAELGVHKQITNRLLEPWAWQRVVVTSTEWANFFRLRRAWDAQPEIRTVADMMFAAMEASEPRVLGDGQWHLPLIHDDSAHPQAAQVSAGRCARASYLTHPGVRDVDDDVALCARLLESQHLSPLEHPCRPMTRQELALIAQPEVRYDGAQFVCTGRCRHFLGNIEGWVQLRKMVEL